MSKRDEFIAFVSRLKAVSHTITDEQRKGLLRQATLEYKVPIDDAVEILQAAGLVVGQIDNYFEILDVTIAELSILSEDTIITYVNASHKKLYATSLAAGGLPRSDGRSQEQWRSVLNEARDTLNDPIKREEHIAIHQLTEEVPELKAESIPESQLADVVALEKPRQDLRNEILPDDVDVPDDMVFIPAGEFQMGSIGKETEETSISTKSVALNGYLIDIYPVTNVQYMTFLDANPQWRRRNIPRDLHDGSYLESWLGRTYPRGQADHPVLYVSWYASMAYAQWIGKRLPTQAEWEKAVRGGVDGRNYPWGDQINIGQANYGMHIGRTTSVKSIHLIEYGIYDMVGNVWEWCMDEYDDNTIHQPSAIRGIQLSRCTVVATVS